MTGAFSRKTSGIFCALTVVRKIKEHRANAVETPLGMTGLLPQLSQQVVFLSPRKVQIFGVCEEAKPLQTNYLIDENEAIGADGSRTHGQNAVISMLNHHLTANSYAERECHLHADNAVGQNKNKTTLHYLTWR